MTRTKRYPANIFWSEEDEGYVAVAPDLPGCSAAGDTEVEALAELKPAIESWLEAAKAAGNPIPQPSRPSVKPKFSGRFVARVPKELHAALAAKAEAEGMSLNTNVVYALTRACASEKAEPKRKVAAKVGA
jgi:predicted RNase H-like HicB family nuclease